ncbi:18399_t:CDS:2 [Acaulospora morrowiae]|uniref:18399_t:CDS:1 n=1 Tax=Acaulospora morrowiae TaxID=94023 RepID=A0A9N9CVU4_9GLOM|nr:18399_t:CDS:2 [Acaulospora morrowiae]
MCIYFLIPTIYHLTRIGTEDSLVQQKKKVVQLNGSLSNLKVHVKVEMKSMNEKHYVRSFYHFGFGIEKDKYQAFLYYQKSIEMEGFDRGLGVRNEVFIFFQKLDVTSEIKGKYETFEYYQKSKINCADRIFSFGDCYQNRTRVEKDRYKTFEY